MEPHKGIRRMRLDGMSQRQIAGVLHISRNTVKKYWGGGSIPRECKDYTGESAIIRLKQLSLCQIETNRDKPRETQQRISKS